LLQLGISDEINPDFIPDLFGVSPIHNLVNTQPNEFLFRALQKVVIGADMATEQKLGLCLGFFKAYLLHKLVLIYLNRKICKDELA